MRRVPLTNSEDVVLIDDDDYDLVMQWKWYRAKNKNGDYYAWTTTQPILQMHRLLLQAPKGSQVDHINHNGLDNRRENLRLATASQNGQNRKGAAGHSRTGVRGVWWITRLQRFQAAVVVDRKTHRLGLYSTLAEAEAAAIEGRKRLMPFSMK